MKKSIHFGIFMLQYLYDYRVAKGAIEFQYRIKGELFMTDHILPHNHGEHLNTELLIDNIAKTEDFQIVADLFKVLGDNSRVRIFWLLCHCEECVINISSMMDMSSPAVSHHLRQLKSYGLITSRREGKEVYYKAADTNQAQLLHNMIEQVIKIPCPEA